jgi:putative ABC transport system ATP-binding protein
MMSPHQRLWVLLAPEKMVLGVVIAYSMGMGLLSLVVPVAVQSLVNTVAFGTLLQPLVILTILVFLALGFLAWMRSLRLAVVELLQQRLFVRTAADVSERMLDTDPAILEQHNGPELVNRFFDVVTIQKSASFLLLDGLAVLLQTFIGMLLLAFYHPFLLVFDFVLLLCIAFILWGLGFRAEPTSIYESKLKYKIVAWMEEVARQPRLFHHHTASDYAVARLDKLLNGYIDARRKHFRIVFRQNVGAFLLQAVASAALLGIGGWLVIRQQLSIGQLVAAELVVASVVDGFSKFGKHLETYYDLLAGVDKLGQIYDLPVQHGGRLMIPERHTGGFSLALPTASGRLSVSSGSHLAILGAQGVSAERVSAWLTGTTPGPVELELEGVPPHHYDPNYLQRHIIILRRLYTISGSLWDNLTLGHPHDILDVRKILEDVGLWPRIQALPEGLDTPLSNTGYPLSLDEVRRLLVARSLLLAPKLLILDGVLDALEIQPNGPLLKTLHTYAEGTTILVLTNRRELLKGWDYTLTWNEQGLLQEVSA